MGEPTTSIKVYLVHGTWAKRARWTREDSPLRKALKKGLKGNVTFMTIPWSGRNSAEQRDKAVVELPSLLAGSAEDGDARFIIAHSHGGNIALDWLRSQNYVETHEPRQRQREARKLRMNGVITMNTPFLAVLPRDPLTFFIHLCALTIALNYLVPRLFVETMFATMIVGLIILVTSLGLGAFLFNRATDKEPAFGRSGDSRTRLLAICTPDDEAFGWLDALNGILNIPALLLHKIALPTMLVVIAVAHYFLQWNFFVPDWNLHSLLTGENDMKAMFFTPAPHIPDDIRQGFTTWFYREASTGPFLVMMSLSVLGYFFTFWAFLALGSLLLTYVVRAVAFGDGFGPTSLLKAMLVRLNVSMTPLLHRDTQILLMAGTFGAWLRHSNIYENPDVLARMVDWMNERLGSKR